MNCKLFLCVALVLGGRFAIRKSDAAIVYPKAPDGGKQIVAKSLDATSLKFIKASRVEDLTIADPFLYYGVGMTSLASGKLLSTATSNGAWLYLLMAGTNEVGWEELFVDEKTKSLYFAGLYKSNFSNETLNALQIAAQWPQIKKEDYEIRRLDIPGISFVAIWLHGKSDDIIIPLPPTYDRLIAYQPYSEKQIIRILAPEARRDIVMDANADKQRLHDENAYATAMTNYEKAHGNQCGPVSLYGMSQPFQEVGPHVQIFTLMGKSAKCGELKYKVKVTFDRYFDGVKKVEILEKLPGKSS